MSSNTDSRVVIITGGTTGLGGACTKLFAQNGYRVLASNISDNEGFIDKLRAEGLGVEFFAADLSAPDISAKAIVARAVELWNRIDVVVNCAGRISHKAVEDVTDADWNEIFAVNLKAPFFMAQAAFPHLAKTKGCIINISSTNAWRVNLKNHLYDSLKAALNHLTKGLALEYRDSGVRVNALMPGGMRTPMVNEWISKYMGRATMPTDLMNPAIADPVMVAPGVLALASDELRWINGAEIPMDGGIHLG
jgi:NAD(P)-dependent dehydrogenase (short-subunit alcohol dehydrogenase family)